MRNCLPARSAASSRRHGRSVRPGPPGRPAAAMVMPPGIPASLSSDPMASARSRSKPATATGSTTCGPFRSRLSICWRRASPESTGGGPQASLSAAFTRFAEHECRGVSPLYETLAAAVAQDLELLALAGAARAGQPAPNLLFAAVHLLLSSETAKSDSLARYYPGLVEPNASSTA